MSAVSAPKNRSKHQAQLRQIPSVDELKTSPAGALLTQDYGETMSLDAIRTVLDEIRGAIVNGGQITTAPEHILDRARKWLENLLAPSLKPIINVTGVIIHTNLGRAPLSPGAQSALSQAGSHYVNVEYDLVKGTRGSRSLHASRLLTAVTGAESAFVVNNNAAAVLLVLTALCKHHQVIISRSQLIEIGGGFRIPEVMAQSGAELVEVGTTNRTHIADYRSAIGEQTAAIMVAHHSNFKIVGFTSEPDLGELSQLARERNLLLLFDQGSGALVDTSSYGLDHETTVKEALNLGADLVCFSGDKLLGGPQAGIICGRGDLMERLKKHPLSRAVRADKLTLSALSATLVPYLTDRYEGELPVWEMIARSLEDVDLVASEICTRLVAAGIDAEVVDGESTIGGGSLPGAVLPSRLVAIKYRDIARLARLLRQESVVARISDEQLLCDPRTLLASQEEELITAIVTAFEESAAS